MRQDTRAALDLLGTLGKPILATPLASRTQEQRAVTIVLVATYLNLLAKDGNLTERELHIAMVGEMNLAMDLAHFFLKWGLTPRTSSVELVIGVVKES